MTFCETTTLVKREHRRRTLTPLKCKRWSCDDCAPIRQRALKADARAGHPNTFLTLTVNPAYFCSPTHRAQELVEAWRKLRRRIIKKHRLKTLPFLAVVERTKNGEPHLHILLRAPFIPQRWLSSVMEELIGAPIVDIRRVDNEGRAASYIAKYLAKNPVKFEGLKRYWRSQDWLPKPDARDDEKADPDVDYHIYYEDMLSVANFLLELGFVFKTVSKDCWILEQPP